VSEHPVRRIVVFLSVCTLTAVISIASVATGQRGKPGKGGSAKPPPKKGQDAGAAASASEPERAPASERAPSASTNPRDGGAGGASGGGATETRTGDGGTKSYRFEEVSIEGRLQSPELVYFLRRVRAEFNAGDLGHRSFMGELSDTKKDPNLR
jgi:hypothetical protein